MPETTASLTRKLWFQTWPMALGVMSLLGFNLVDSVFIARLGTEPLAAQSLTFPLHFLIVGIQVGLGIAIAALISRVVGAGEGPRARRLGTLVMAGGGVLMALLAGLLWLFHEPAFVLLGADQALLERIRPFWRIWLFAAWTGAFLYFGYSVLRAHGHTRFPGFMMMGTSVVNLVLDPVLIFGFGPVPALGLEGAAWATLAAFALGNLVVLRVLTGQGWLTRRELAPELRASLGPFWRIAWPATVSQLMPPLAAMLATGVVARMGPETLAAWGLMVRLEGFSIVLVLGLTMALPPWLGQCYGAGNWTEIRQMMRIAARGVLVWQAGVGLVLCLAATPVAMLLAGSGEVAERLAWLLRWLPPSTAFLGICMLVVSASNALGWPVRAMVISFLRLFACYLPLLWLGSELAGFTGLAIGAALGNVLAGTMAWVLYRRAEAGAGR